ncbi:hypothetical protein BVY03_00865 [bacterium K02(2017)]|nr:hypothetical protein BVY03_00865 [bacterium K02(2017)]
MSAQKTEKRKYIGVNFKCCGAYTRIYHNTKLNAYIGNCPRCLKPLKVQVNKEKATTSNRFFDAK